MEKKMSPLSRRDLLLAAPVLLASSAAPSLLLAQEAGNLEAEKPIARNNFSSFRLLDWQDYFENTKNGAIL